MYRPSHISVCICTYKRVALLEVLLAHLERQVTDGLFTYSLVIVDNDPCESAREVVRRFSRQSTVAATYSVEPARNIALARNKALEQADGEFLVFIDDDEYPVSTWLKSLFRTRFDFKADGVLGPVIPYFPEPPPQWVLAGGFFERPRHATGHRIGLSEARTGNVLMRRDIVGTADKFRAEFATGGEDVDFFRRLLNKRHQFVWCDDGVVYEAVPPSRCSRAYLLKRALLRGQNSVRHRNGIKNLVLRSIIALPTYGLALPFLGLLGQEYFMNYLIKSCDHLGRLLALVNLGPIRNRDF
jgi:succinoglycan biosynthesis protein ExoM